MKRIIAMLMALLCLMSFFACGDSKKESDNGNVAANINITEIKDKIISELEIKDPFDLDSDMLYNLMGIEPSDVKESASFVTLEGVFPDKAIMIVATDSNAASRIAENLNVHLQEVLAQAQDYDAENLAIAQKCKVICEGDVVALFISKNHERMQEIFYGK